MNTTDRNAEARRLRADPEARTQEARRIETFLKDREETTVRETCQWGECRILGKLIKETAKSYTYEATRGEWGQPLDAPKAKRVSKIKKVKHARCRDLTRHTTPCPSCPGHRHPDACVHGRVAKPGQPCESCLAE